jgi:glycosyltransferase involved in cell wall biosynthesis
MESGLVSTIIPVFNRPAMVREAVASVLAQTWRPIEIIIIDDGSTDETGAVVDALRDANPDVIRVIHQANTGVGLAREAGRLAARGEFIQHLDSDDLLLPRKFELQVEALRANPDCGAAYGWTRAHLPDGSVRTQPEKRTGEPIAAMFPAMLQSRFWHTNTPLYRASVVHAAGPWLPLSNEEDWEFDARVAAQGVRLAYVPDWLCETRHHGDTRLSMHGMTPQGLRMRARAHELILRHAQTAGIGTDEPEMRHFARELFLLCRQCGAVGLAAESRKLFELAREASGQRANAPQFVHYQRLARLLGWRTLGQISNLVDRFRP